MWLPSAHCVGSQMWMMYNSIVWNANVGEAYVSNPLWNSDGKISGKNFASSNVVLRRCGKQWVAWDAKLKCGCESECKARVWLWCNVYKLLGDSMWPPKRVAKLKCGFVEMCISDGRLKCGPPAMYGSDVAQMWIKRNTKLCETQMWIMGEKQISLCRSPTLKIGRKNV
jgi:hypothetical protein